jgi:hypothetical protein
MFVFLVRSTQATLYTISKMYQSASLPILLYFITQKTSFSMFF